MVTHYPGLIDLHQVIPEVPSPDTVHRQVEYQDLAGLKQGHIQACLTRGRVASQGFETGLQAREDSHRILGLEELRFLKVGQEDLVEVLKLHGRKSRKHHISEELPAIVDAEPADVDHRLEQACTVEFVQLGLLMHEELTEHTTFLGGHISGYVLLDELQAEDGEARVGRRLGDEV